MPTGIIEVVKGVKGDPGTGRKLTIGDLMNPALPSTMPATKGAVTIMNDTSDWDNIGPAYDYNHVSEVIEFNGEVIPTIFGATVDPSGQQSSKVLDVETVMIGTDAYLYYYNVYEDQTLMVWVDDEQIIANPLSQGPAGIVILKIHMNKYGVYNIRSSGGFYLYSAATNMGTTLQKPTPRTGIGVVSDSYYEAFPEYNVAESNAPQLRTYTGFKVFNMAEGGTGFLNPGIFQPFGHPDRLSALEDIADDLSFLLINGSVNDQLYNPADLQVAMVAYYNAVREIAPDLPIIQVGFERINDADPESLFWSQRITAQKNAIAVSKNVIGYIDPLTEKWFTGTGQDDNPTNDGNQQYLITGIDDVHPLPRGSQVYGHMTAMRMRPMKASL